MESNQTFVIFLLCLPPDADYNSLNIDLNKKNAINLELKIIFSIIYYTIKTL
jgi:hypothetical protein